MPASELVGEMPAKAAAAAANPATRAYVAFLAGDGEDSVKAVVELARALRGVGSAYPLVVAVLPGVPESHRRILVSHGGCIVRELQPVHPPENQQANFAMAYSITGDHSKLRVWELVEFERMVYLDAGVEVPQNIDELFELEIGPHQLHAAASSSSRGMFPLEPSRATAEFPLDCLRVAPPTPSADYDIGKARDTDLLRRLRFAGGVGDLGTGRTATAGIGGSSRYWATRLGFAATGFAVAGALHCFPAAEEVSRGLDAVGAALLLFLFLLAIAGVNLLTAGLCLTDAAAARILLLFLPAQSALRNATAFARENTPVLAVSAASAATTGIVIGGAANPLLCFLCFALLLLAVSAATAGLASSTR